MGERRLLNYRRGLASRPDRDVVFRKRRRAFQAGFPGFPLLAVSRPQPKRASESRALPSHNSIVTSAINSRRSRPFNRRAAERINSSSGDSNNMIPTFHGTFMRRTRPAVPPRRRQTSAGPGSLPRTDAWQKGQFAENPRRDRPRSGRMARTPLRGRNFFPDARRRATLFPKKT